MLMLKLTSSCEIKGGIYRIYAFDRDFTSFSSKYLVLHTSQNNPVWQRNGNVMCGFYLLL